MALRDLTEEELTSFAEQNDSSLVDVEAPNNTVYDEKNDRVLSLPQTLDESETQYIIDRDIDKKGTFFAQQPMDDYPSLTLPPIPQPAQWFQGMYNEVIAMPGRVGQLGREQAELSAEEAKTDTKLDDLKNITPLNIIGSPGATFRRFMRLIGEDESMRQGSEALIERNKQYIAKYGYKDTAVTTMDTISRDIGAGATSLLSALGVTFLTRSPATAAVMFGAIQNSDIYKEGREAGLEPSEASAAATKAMFFEAGAEKLGLDALLKAMKGNGAVKRFTKGFIVEGTQESIQQAGEEVITNTSGIRDQSKEEAAENILYSGFIGSLLGGTSGATIGSFVEKDAIDQGFSKEDSAALRKYAEDNIDLAREDMGEFLRKEVSPLAADDERAREFVTLMQQFDNRVDVIDPDALSPKQKEIFDEYLAYFNSSVLNTSSKEAVEKDFFSKLSQQSRPENLTDEQWQELAMASSKVLGARADAAARALGITPREWYDSWNLSVEVKRTPEQAAQVYKEKLDAIRETRKPDLNKEEVASTQAQLDKLRAPAQKEVSTKKPILAWIKSQGGIKLDSQIAGELRNLGITPKTAPGLFKKNPSVHAGELDNIPASEFNTRFGVAAEMDGNGYVDRDWLIEAIRDEQFGVKLGAAPQERTADDMFIEELDKAGLDWRTVTAEEVVATLGTDADVLAAARAMGVAITGNQSQQILGIMEANPEYTLEDALDEFNERQAIMDEARMLAQRPVPAEAEAIITRMVEENLMAYATQQMGERSAKSLVERAKDDKLTESDLMLPLGLGDMALRYRDRVHESVTLNQRQPITETENFKRWFGDSKVVDADGNPLVVYHGTRSVFEAFDLNKSGENGQAVGKGFYFTNSKGLAEGYGQVGEFYLRAENPAFSLSKKTITLPQVKEILTALEKYDEYLLSNYGDIETEGRATVLNRALDDIYAASKDDADVIASFINIGGVERDTVMDEIIKITGKDGFITSADIAAMGVESSDKIYVVLSPTQIKSVQNRGTFDLNDASVLNQDINNAKGNITFTPDKTLIKLFEKADASTLLHELGHLFLRDMRATARASKRPMVKRDYEIIKEWLGVEGSTFTEAQEEKFARGFEAWLREGKAPKEELNGIFERFKEWLTFIYRSVRDLDVEINDEIRQVFERMLGGDFSRTEEQIKARDEQKLERDYELVAAPPPSSLPDDTARLFRDVGGLANDAFTPVSTRLGKIDAKLKHAVRQFTFRTGLYSHQDRVAVKGFVEAVGDKFLPTDYRIFDLALKNRDTVKVEQLVEKYGIQEEWDAVRKILDDLYNQALDVGLDMAYVQDYFPRQVKRDTALEYLGAIRQKPEWSEIKHALEEADPLGDFTAEEQAVFVNTYLRGFTTNRLNLTKPSFSKARLVDYVTPEFNKYYDDSMSTLLQYITGLRHGIESRKLFGKSEKETEKNIGKYVLGLIDQGVIDAKQEKELTRILKAVVEPTGTRGAVSWAKNAGYIYLMGNFTSAVTQIQDLAFSMANNGYYRTLKAVGRSIVRKPVLRKEDVGIDNILQEFESETRASNAVRKIFRIVGLELFDNIGKETYMGAAYDRLRSQNKKNSPEWQQFMDDVFGAEAEKTKQDLKDGVLSENVKYLLFSELSDVQPISLAEMPVAYLRGGNGRVFYMLKTYTVKFIDVYRNRVFDEIASGDPKRMAKGVYNLTQLAVALMVMGMASDGLKDLILGRPIDIDDLITDNILKLFTLTKYQIYRAREEGIANAFWKTLFVPPVAAPVDDLGKDIAKIGFGDKPIEDSEVAGKVPVVGKFYYWWYGGGRTKIEKEQ